MLVLNGRPLFFKKSRGSFGGAEVQLYYLASKLAQDHRFEVHCVLADHGQSVLTKKDGIIFYKFTNPLLTKDFLKYTPYLKGIYGHTRLIQLLKKINADIYIQRAAGVETADAALAAKLAGGKFIYHSSCSWDVDGSYRMVYPLGHFFYSLGIRLADAVMVQSRWQQRQLRKNYNKKSIIRSSAVPLDELKPCKKTDILWVGKADRRIKQPGFFLKLAQEFVREKFVMVCPPTTDRDYYNLLKRRANKIKNLDFIGKVRFDQIDTYFKKAKIFVNTSSIEGFPNTLLQAARRRTPVVTLNIDPDGIISRYKMGFCAKGEFNAMESSLKELIKDEKLRAERGENAHRYVKEHHDMNKIIERDKKMLRNLVDYEEDTP